MLVLAVGDAVTNSCSFADTLQFFDHKALVFLYSVALCYLLLLLFGSLELRLRLSE